mmetsp:Transcript_100345/g.289757  ORF Transcript_100345/g.289757 Transcript_100345/m.289757 type:complete len:216 (-) Transcript_100345:297-944(-)
MVAAAFSRVPCASPRSCIARAVARAAFVAAREAAALAPAESQDASRQSCFSNLHAKFCNGGGPHFASAACARAMASSNNSLMRPERDCDGAAADKAACRNNSAARPNAGVRHDGHRTMRRRLAPANVEAASNGSCPNLCEAVAKAAASGTAKASTSRSACDTFLESAGVGLGNAEQTSAAGAANASTKSATAPAGKLRDNAATSAHSSGPHARAA